MNLVTIEQLPLEILDRIFDYLPYNTVSNICRPVNRKFNSAAQLHLNNGLHRFDKLNKKTVANVMFHLPRRDSERVNHLLNNQKTILNYIPLWLMPLESIYRQYLNSNVCCFIAGKVLDELFSVLRKINKSVDEKTKIASHYDFLTELRDLCKMAAEHFESEVKPSLSNPKRARISPMTAVHHLQTTDSFPASAKRNSSSKEGKYVQDKVVCLTHNSSSTNETDKLKSRVERLENENATLVNKINEQEEKFDRMKSDFDEMKKLLTALSRKVDVSF